MNRRTFLRASGATASALPLSAVFSKANNSAKVTVSKLPATAGSTKFYVGNRPPLLPSPYAKLPIGSIEPRGWLRQQLLLMADGMTGHLHEFSHYLAPTSGWLTFKPQDAGWEEMPYWLRGYGDLGYVLKDPRIIGEAKHWLDATLSSQQLDGYFGPPLNKAKDDLWPNMLMLNALQSLYESTGDARVLPFMSRYCRYELDLPQRKLLPGSWQKIRGGDNLASAYWLYNHTGDASLLRLGRRLFEATADWTLGPQTQHGVNNAQGFREPATYYQQSQNPKHLEATERNYSAVMDTYGQVPGGMCGADENWRPGKTGPQQAAETCSMVEFMHSFEMLLKITGNPVWADRCETVAFNSLPAALTPELKGLHYLTAPNLVECDPSGQHDFDNPGYLLPFSPREVYRCCQHNVAMGWPYYAEHLWLATQGNGLAAVLYAECSVEARVGHGVRARIEERTDYPFGETAEFRLSLSEPTSFPLLLRVPGWCEGAVVAVNGARLSADAPPASYISIERLWRDGDRVELELPMKISLTEWMQHANAVSVNYGPLSFSLKIGERWEKVGGTGDWPDLAAYPSTPWNFGLNVNRANPAASFRVARKTQTEKQPFNLAAAPIELRGQGRLISDWKLTGKMASTPPVSPVSSTERAREITLIPMGCARLRVSVFPTIA
jgi:hypothetical protein